MQRPLAELEALLFRGKTRKSSEDPGRDRRHSGPKLGATGMATTFVGENPAELRVGFGIDEDDRAALEEELLGKAILVLNGG